MFEKIAIIGAGNMGAAIARGLIQSGKSLPQNIWVADPSEKQLEALKADHPAVNVTTSNAEAVSCGELVIVAVKPWLALPVIHDISQAMSPGQALCSIAAGITLESIGESLSQWSGPTFRIMPNTAIAMCQSMTFITSLNAPAELRDQVVDIFSALGLAIFVDEKLLPAATAVASCGIAYVMRYIRASQEGAVELGFTPAQAREVVLQTVQGAVSLLRHTGEHPEAAIDRVTTAGGLTIRGLNALEAAGFTPAIIAGLRASL